MIEFELFTDLLCDGCAVLHEEFNKFFTNMTYLGRPVSDQITVSYGFLALPYHHASWIPHRLLPYITNECRTTSTCKFEAYTSYTYKNRYSFLDATDTNYDDLVTRWISTCRSKFGWPLADLQAVYNRTSVDKWNSEHNSRLIWGLAASRGVFGTPTIFVNGISLQNNPQSADDWLKLLDDVYKSQAIKFNL
jgi:hypothetical protein